MNLFFNDSLIGFRLGYFPSIIYCFILAAAFVGSLYFKADRKLGRDHPSVIKSRFKRVTAISILSLIALYLCSTKSIDTRHFFSQWLGLYFPTYFTLFLSIFIPIILTMLLFLGPIVQQYYNQMIYLYADIKYWKANFTDYVWLRNIVMGPLMEEVVFRGCMLPVLVAEFGETTSIFLSPSFFGVAHLHHMLQSIYDGTSVRIALLQALFQLGYTTVFGMYSAFLFLSTGSLYSAIFVHSFCNHMGFPNFSEISLYNSTKTRFVICASYIVGALLWMFFLIKWMDPKIYDNRIYFTDKNQ